MQYNFQDLSGQRFGRWTVIERAENRNGNARWLCECNCEKKTRKILYGSNLRSGNTKSCGCHAHELTIERNKYVNKRYNEWIFEDNQVIGICHNNPNCKFIIDIDDYEKCKDYCWMVSSDGYIRTRDGTSGKAVKLHRLIMNPPKQMQVDHINGDTLNNKKSNLRICSRHQNNMNKSISRRNTSGVTGVSLNKKLNKWIAKITYNYERIYLGAYVNKEDAIEARKQAEIKYFGEYRRR